MDKLLSVNVYDSKNNAVPGADVFFDVKYKNKYETLGPLETQGIKDKPVSIQIPTKLDSPVIKVTTKYKDIVKTVEVDTRQTINTIIKFDVPLVEDSSHPVPQPPPNPWIAGSFYLAVFVAAAFTLLAIARLVPWYFVPAVIIGAILVLTVIGALTLRGNAQLHDEPFLKLMEMSFRNLPLIKMLGRKPKD